MKIYILILCSFIFQYVLVMNNGHLLAEKNPLACSLALYLWISGCRSCLESNSYQNCPWLSAFFLNPHFWKPRLIRGQMPQASYVLGLKSDYKQVNKIHNIYILNAALIRYIQFHSTSILKYLVIFIMKNRDVGC